MTGIDPQCSRLVAALNKLDGIETISSCCGHHRTHYHIAFECNNWESLFKLTCLTECTRWTITVCGGHSYAGEKVYFYLHYPRRKRSIYEEGYKLADAINAAMEKEKP